MRVLVVGGGPSGSLAALLLARGGAGVTLVEQSRFPRDKVCGECLSALGLEVLDRHGHGPAVRRDGRMLTRAAVLADGATVRLELPSPMLGLSRARLDAVLLDAAVAAGAEVRQPARAERVVPDSGGVGVRVRDLATNVIDEMAVDYVIVADGRAALLPVRPAATGDLGIKAHFTGVAADVDAITLFGGLGCYGGVAPIEGARWNAAFSVPRDVVAAARGDVAALWANLVGRSDALRAAFADAVRESDWLASPLPRHRLTDWPERVIPVGAAAGAIEPVGGEGMGTALRSAELAADALRAGELGGLAAAYRALWARRSWFCRVGAVLLSGGSAADGVRLAGVPAIGRLAMAAVGK